MAYVVHTFFNRKVFRLQTNVLLNITQANHLRHRETDSEIRFENFRICTVKLTFPTHFYLACFIKWLTWRNLLLWTEQLEATVVRYNLYYELETMPNPI